MGFHFQASYPNVQFLHGNTESSWWSASKNPRLDAISMIWIFFTLIFSTDIVVGELILVSNMKISLKFNALQTTE